MAAMVTSKTYEQLMEENTVLENRMKRWKTAEEKQRLIEIATIFHKQITILLNNMNRDLLLLFKVNDFLRTIDNKLGSPFNTYSITVNI